MNFFKNHYRSSLLPVQLLSLLVLALCVSCQWNKSKGDSPDKTSPNKSGVESPTSVAAKATDISVIKKTPDSMKGADRVIKLDIENKGGFTTEKGKLKLLIERQVGSAAFIEGSTLTEDGKYYTLELPAVVDPNQGKSSYDLKIDPKNDNKATFKIRLQYDNKDINNPFVVSWEKGELPKEVDLYLARKSPENIEGKERTINLEIENKGPKDTELGKTKLRIERTDGKAAFITGSTQMVSSSIYALNLPLVKAQSKLIHNLTIDPQIDLKASFKIQLQYNNTNVGNPLMVNWEKGAALEVVSITKDPTTGQVNAAVKNTGTKVAESGKVTAEVKTKGADLGGNPKKEVEVKDVKPGEVKTLPLAPVNFGKSQSGQDNKTAVFEFQTSCSTDCPKAPKPTIIKTFTKSEIVISLDIEDYDIGKPTFTLRLKNTGKDTAEGLKLKYQNISEDNEGKLATLDNKTQDDGITIGNLAKDQEYKHTFTLDLKDAAQAEFDFKVIYDNNPIGEIKKKFQTKPLKLSLEVVDPSMDNNSNYILYGAKNECKLRITKKFDSRDINLKDLTLSIQPLEDGIGSTISQTGNGSTINEVAVNNLGSDIVLYINPSPKTKEANFRFQLKYKGKDIGSSVLIGWREYPITITSPERLVGDQEGSFQIISQAPINNLNEFQVTLEGEHETTFHFSQASGKTEVASVTLSEVAAYDTTNKKINKSATKPIKFSIDQKSGQKKATLNIILKRGTEEIARKSVNWVDQGIGLAIQPSYYSSLEQSLLLSVQNTTNQNLDLQKVKVKLQNKENIPFTLGNASGAVIEKRLAGLIGQHILEGGAKIYTNLRINMPLVDKLATGVSLQLLDSEDQVIDQAYFIFYYVFGSVIKDEFLKMLNGNEENFLKQLENLKNDVGSLLYLETVLTRLIRTYSDLSDELIKIKETNPAFKQVVNMQLASDADSIGKWEKFKQHIKETISELSDKGKEEQAISQWCKKTKIDIKSITEKIENSKDEIENLNNISDLMNFLIVDYDNDQKIAQQSIKALYKRYQDIIEEVEALLLSHEVVYFEPVNGDSDAVKELKEMYNSMTAELPSIKKQVQDRWDAGFKKFGEVITEEQRNLKFAKNTDQSQINQVFKLLTAQKKALKAWKRQSDYAKELVLHPADMQNKLVEFYQSLAEKNLTVTKAVKATSRDHGNLEKFAKLGIEIADDALELAQTTNNPSAAEAAVKAYEAAIEAWIIHEHKRRVPHDRLRKASLTQETDSDESKQVPTTLQVLESNLKGLKSDYKEISPKRNILGRLLNPFKRTKKM